MKYILLLLPITLFGQIQNADTVYPIQLTLNSIELNCFKPEQSAKIYNTYILYETMKKDLEKKDSIYSSVTRENDKLSEIIANDNILVGSLETKANLYKSIVAEKDVQLKLKDRENLITALKSKKTNFTMEIFVFLLGGVLGYAVAK